MTTVEHSIPVSVLYDDVLMLYAQSGTGATPTHVVSYGGAFGEEYEWAHYDVPNDPKCVVRTNYFWWCLCSTCLLDCVDSSDMIYWKGCMRVKPGRKIVRSIVYIYMIS